MLASSARAGLRPALETFSRRHLVTLHHLHQRSGFAVSRAFYSVRSEFGISKGSIPVGDTGLHKISSQESFRIVCAKLRASHVRFSSSIPAVEDVDWNESVGDKKLTIEECKESVDGVQHEQQSRYIPGIKASIESGSSCRYMVVFQYGSVVLFNIAEQEEEGYLQIVKKHASGLLSETRKDDYAVVEKPSLETWMQDGPDYIVLKRFDIDGIRIIGSVLGQSIALDHFVRQVDGMVAEFTDLNRGMEKTGTFTMKQKKLFQLVGKANSNLADVILKLGLFERSDIAWKNANYAQIWEYLRDEYELTQRFGSLDFKLKFVEHNVRFFLEILQNRKSDFLEWLIIILISAEIVIAIYNIIRESEISPL